MASWKDGADGSQPRKKSKPAAREKGKPREATGAGAGWRGSSSKPRRNTAEGVWESSGKVKRPVQSSIVGGYALLLLVGLLICLFAWVIIISPKRPEILVISDKPETAGRATLLTESDYPSEAESRLTGSQLPAPSEAEQSADDEQEPPRVVFLTGHGLVRPRENPVDGFEPLVLVEEESPSGPKELSVESLLTAKAGQPTVVALDTSRGRVRWEEGQLVNLFPGAVEKLVQDAKQDNWPHVIVSCGLGQRDWALNPLNGRTFAREFFSALSGEGSARKRLRELYIWPTITPTDLGAAVTSLAKDRARLRAELWQTPLTLANGRSEFLIAPDDAPDFPDIKLTDAKNRFITGQKYLESIGINSPEASQRRGKSPLLWARALFDWSERQQAVHAQEAGFEAFHKRAKSAIARLLRPPAKWPAGLETVADRHKGILGEQANKAHPRAVDGIRTAIAVRRTSEDLANWSDPRVNAVLRKELEKAEQKRRDFDDRLILGDWDPRHEKDLNRTYSDLKQKFEIFAAAFSLTDKVFDQAPWIGEWWADSFHLAAFSSEAKASEHGNTAAAMLRKSQEAYQAALGLSVSLHQLAVDGLRPEGSGSPVPALDADVNELEKQWKEVRPRGLRSGDRYAMYASLRKSANPAADQPAELMSLTKAPTAQDGTGTVATEEDEGRGEAYLTRFGSELVSQGAHPVDWMLAAEAATNDPEAKTPAYDANWFFERGQAVIRSLKGVLDSLPQSSPPLAKTERVENDRGRLNRAALQQLVHRSIAQRRAAWLIARKVPAPELPTTDEFWAACEREQRLWLARRAIRDFWGDGLLGDSRTKPKDGFYFAQLARSYLLSDDKTLRKIVKDEIDEASKLARNIGVETQRAAVAETDLDDSDRPTELEIRLTATVEGRPAWSLTDKEGGSLVSNGETQGMNNGRVAMGGTNTIQVSAVPDARSGTENLYYRGHRRQGAVQLAKPETLWRTVVHRPTPVTELRPTVTVHGKDKQVVDVVIVFDASDSMKDPDKEIDGVVMSKMAGAKAVVSRLLRNMAVEGHERFRCGLVIYGHRANWDNKQVGVNSRGGLAFRSTLQLAGSSNGTTQNRGLRASNRHFDWDGDIHPSADVEAVRRIQLLRTKEDATGLFDAYVADLTPFGATPLYLAMSEALSLFESRSNDRHLIVLTDGENNAPIPDQGSKKALGKNLETGRRDFAEYVSYKPLLDDLQTAKKRGLCPSVRVIAYGSDVDASKFNWLKDSTKLNGIQAKVIPTENRAKLDEALVDWFDETLKLPKYQLERNNETVTDEIEFNTPLIIDNWRKRSKGEYAVVARGLRYDVASQPVYLEGWEDLHLGLQNDATPWSLSFLPYKASDFGYKADELVARRDRQPWREMRRGSVERSRGEWKIAALRRGNDGKGQAGETPFHVVLQRNSKDEQSTAPRYVWAEIQPIDERGNPIGKPFYGSDVKCMRSRNVPVLQWTTEEWDSRAEEAQLRLWAAFDTGDGSLNAEPWEVSRTSPKKKKIAGSTWQANWSQDHRGNVLTLSSRGERALKTIVAPKVGYVYQSVKREYDHDSNPPQVKHTFVFATEPTSDLPLRFVPVEDLKREGWEIAPAIGTQGEWVEFLRSSINP